MAADEGRRDQPGRWVGGLVGALLSLAVGAVGLLLGESPGEPGPFVGLDGFLGLGLGGLPIAFLVGRALLPEARRAGLAHASMVGLAFGLVAPPLGAVLVVSWLAVPALLAEGLADAIRLTLILPFAFVYSYTAAVATVPAGLAWSAIVWLVPEATLRRAAAPGWLARIGARHVVAVALAAWVSLGLVPYVGEATDAWTCSPAITAGHAWSPDGSELVTTGSLPDLPAAVLRVDRGGEATVLERGFGVPSGAAAGPAGSVAWIEATTSGSGFAELWTADPRGSRSLGRLPPETWSGVAWWDGSWVSLGSESGLARLEPEPGEERLAVTPIQVRGQRVGAGDRATQLSASADGRLVGWAAPGDPGWVALLGPDRFDRLRLPAGAHEPSLAGVGEALVYREGWDGPWRRLRIGSSQPDPGSVASAGWSSLRIAADGALAARSEGIDEGKLCIAAGP